MRRNRHAQWAEAYNRPLHTVHCRLPTAPVVAAAAQLVYWHAPYLHGTFTVGRQERRVRNPLDWNYLTEVPLSDQIWGPLSIAYLVLFIVGLVATLFAGNWAERTFPNHRLHRETVQRISSRATWGWIVGLTFFVCRFFGLNFLGWRLWLYVSLLAAIGFAAYTVWWLRTKYPPRVAAFRKEQRRRAYMRPGSAAALALAANTRTGSTREERQQRVERADAANRDPRKK